MSLDLNDPRLTAYALNELEPRERAEIERLLADDPAARELVNELKETADFLSAELAIEPAPELTGAQKLAIRNGHSSESEEDVSTAVGRDGLAPRRFTEPPYNGTGDPSSKKKSNILPFPRWRFAAYGAGLAAAAAITLLVLVHEFGAIQVKTARVSDAERRDFLLAINEKADEAKPMEESVVATSTDSVTTTDTYVAGAQLGARLAKEKDREHVGRLESVDKQLAASAPPSKSNEFNVSAYKLKTESVDVPAAPSVATTPAPASAAVAGSAQMADSKSGKEEGIAQYGLPTSSRRADLLTDRKIQVMNGEDSSVNVSFYYDTNGRPVNAPAPNTESYTPVAENEFLGAAENPLSTFSIDVDTASYANMRRFIEGGQRPPTDAVRIEEMLNYFTYDYAPPTGSDPFSANVEIADCPWDREHRLVRVGLKGHEIARNERPASNLVFLIDVSGSMNEPDKLPLVKQSLEMLVKKLRPSDRIAIAVYAGNSGLVLPSTAATPANKPRILASLDNLEAGGSTNGGEGIQLAYSIARDNFIKGGCNRVLLCTDGDFNVGVTSQGDLISLIQQKARSGVFLSVLGFGTGNLKDSTMMNLADKGNGNYAYIDSLKEGRKVLVDQMGGTLVTIAKDVKIQIEFNPAKVAAYRLIGYEKRMLAKEDFNNDKKDAGEIGAGHTVTALYEVVPAGQTVKPSPSVDPLKYQPNPPAAKQENERTGIVAGIAKWFSDSDDLLTLKIRYKQPDGNTSKKLEFPIKDRGEKLADASGDFKFAASVATFGLVLRDSPYKGDASYDLALELARAGKGEDEEGYRSEFIRLVKSAAELP